MARKSHTASTNVNKDPPKNSEEEKKFSPVYGVK